MAGGGGDPDWAARELGCQFASASSGAPLLAFLYGPPYGFRVPRARSRAHVPPPCGEAAVACSRSPVCCSILNPDRDRGELWPGAVGLRPDRPERDRRPCHHLPGRRLPPAGRGPGRAAAAASRTGAGAKPCRRRGWQAASCARSSSSRRALMFPTQIPVRCSDPSGRTWTSMSCPGSPPSRATYCARASNPFWNAPLPGPGPPGRHGRLHESLTDPYDLLVRPTPTALVAPSSRDVSWKARTWGRPGQPPAVDYSRGPNPRPRLRPLQDLAIIGRVCEMKRALEAHPVVAADHYQPGAGQGRAVEVGLSRGAEGVGAAVDPEEHRQRAVMRVLRQPHSGRGQCGSTGASFVSQPHSSARLPGEMPCEDHRPHRAGLCVTPVAGVR